MQAQHVRAVVEGEREGAFEVGVQRLDLRREPCLRLALGPQQLVAELRELRRATLLAADQRMTEQRFPAPEFAPDVAIGKAERARRRRDGAVFAHRVQQLHERIADQRTTASARRDGVGEFDVVHGRRLEAGAGGLCKCNP